MLYGTAKSIQICIDLGEKISILKSMRISATEEYGLRCILQLAKLEEGQQVAASAIADAEGISIQYASKMMHLFRRAKLVESVRGLHGGFRLAKKPEAISLHEVFGALGKGSEEHSFCDRYSGDRDKCVHINDCAVRPVWQVLFEHFDLVLHKLSLSDLVSGEESARMRLAAIPLQETRTS